MNPPFSGLQDQAHIRHAYALLRPGGIVVSVCTPGFQYRQDARSRAFKAWLEDLDAEIQELPEGAFAPSGTNVRTLAIKIHKEA
jgi:type I restriction-modification system DNA methylase subunit